MLPSARNVVVGVFESPGQVQQAVEELLRLGFCDDQIGVLALGDAGPWRGQDEGAMAGMEEGAATGALAGLGLGLACAAAALAGGVPGLVIGGGLLATLAGGAGAGAAIGTVVGALVGLGVPAGEAEWYEAEVRAGQIVVSVQTADRYNEAFAVLRRHGAYDVASGRPSARPATDESPAFPAIELPGAAGADHTTLDVPVHRHDLGPGPQAGLARPHTMTDTVTLGPASDAPAGGRTAPGRGEDA